MNDIDLSRLSYKELQSLAVKCKIPGNIKKQLLLEILHFLKCGNNSEVTKILNEIKKNRKKRTKKFKTPKTENSIILSSTNTANVERAYKHKTSEMHHINTPIYRDQNSIVVHEFPSEPFFTDFAFTIGSKEYSSVPDELLRHRVILGKNVNEINRRAEMPSFVINNSSTNEEGNQYMRRNNESHFHNQQQPLLVQLLQAPVGADLSQIHINTIGNQDASSSSSTKTASEDIEQDIFQETNHEAKEFSGRGNNNDFMTDTPLALPLSLDSNVECTFRLDSIPARDPQLHCHEWIETTMINEISPQLEGNSSLNTSALLPYREYEDQNFINLDNTISPISIVQPSVQQYNCDNNHFFTNTGTDFEDRDLMSELPLVPIINSSENLPRLQSFMNTSVFDNTQTKISTSQYEAGYSSQIQTPHEYTISNSTDYPYVPGFYRELTANEGVVVENYSSENEQAHSSRDGKFLLDSYWPRWTQNNQNTVHTGGRLLENTLNLCTPNYVDLTKLNETCSVYSNKTPVMTLRRGLNSSMSTLSACADKSSGNGLLQNSVQQSSPQRYNYNASNWLLYAGGSVETTTITDRKTYDPILPTSYGVISQHQPESIF